MTGDPPSRLAWLSTSFRNLGTSERVLVLLPAVVAAGYAASAVPEGGPLSLVLRVGVVFLTLSVVSLGLTAAIGLVRSDGARP